MSLVRRTGAFFIPGNGVDLGRFVRCVVDTDNGEKLVVETSNGVTTTIDRSDFKTLYITDTPKATS